MSNTSLRSAFLSLWLACSVSSIVVEAAEPDWRVPLSGQTDLGDRVVVEGTWDGQAFKPRLARIEPSAADKPALTPLPLEAPLLQRMVPTVFGGEERASLAMLGDRVVLTCQAGTRPAGLLLEAGERLPHGAAIEMHLDTQAKAGFAIGIGPARRDPVTTSPLPPDGRVAINGLPGDIGLRITLLCPDAGGMLALTDLRLASTAQPPRPPRSGWAWRPALWRDEPQRLIDAAKTLRLAELFVAVEIDAKAGLVAEERFAAFVTQAREAAISVIVVEGDAAMALPAGRDLALQRLRHLAAYQDAAAPAGRLAGLQYDIEPYLLPDFGHAPEMVMRGWAETITALRSQAPVALDVVLPFWLMSDEHALRHVMPALARGADSITIMAYRTKPQAIVAAAEPLLAWAGRAGRRARIALENGPLPDETHRVYQRRTGGELRIERDSEGRFFAVLDPGGREGARFGFSHEIAVPAANVSFLGDRARLDSVAALVEPLLAAWPAFAGIALHGVIE